MRSTILLICSIIFFFSCKENKTTEKEKPSIITNLVKTQTETKTDPTEFFTPGPMHKWLASFTGTWEADVTSYMNPEKPERSKLIQTYTMILNGLVQEAKLTGTIMGMQFEGRSLNGYDNAKKKFITTWVDNFSSGFTFMMGDYDSSSYTLHLRGTQTNPSDGKDMSIREVMKIVDPNMYTLEMYGDGPEGKEIKYMEGTFRRTTF